MATITQDIRPYDDLVARNRCLNAMLRVDTAGWGVFFGSTSSGRYTSAWWQGLQLPFGFAGTMSAASQLLVGFADTTCAPGETINASLCFYVESATPMRMTVEFLTVAGAHISFVYGPAVMAGADIRLSQSVVVPAGAGKVKIFAESLAIVPSGYVWVAGGAQITAGAPLEDPFDGATADTVTYQYDWQGAANASISTKSRRNPVTDPVDPTQILAYDVVRKSRNLVHDILLRAAPEVTLSPAGLRSGTIKYLFDGAAELARAEAIHSHAKGLSTITLSGGGPFGTMKYIPVGEINTKLELEGTTVYSFTTGFQELL